MNDYPGFDLAGCRGSRIGAPARRAIRLGLCLVLFAGLAAACGSGKPSEQSGQPSLSPAASAPGPSVSFDPTAFASDGGGFGSNGSAIEDAGYTERYGGMEGLDHLAEAYAVIVHGLPTAIDLNQVKAEKPGMVSCEVTVEWEPMGRRDTVLPPGGHGERIYEIDVDLGPYIKGGDAVAYVWFLSRAEGDALDKIDLTATPQAYPNQAFSFKIDKEAAGALLDLFWVKGAPPTD
ncbi:MAG: hypothetical protein ABSE70_10545 [Candidatus Limnocylindrales bacterium]